MADPAARPTAAVTVARNRRADDPPDSRAAAATTGIRLCAGADLTESGRAHLFDVLFMGQPARAFVLRHGGRVVAYINRCAHVPAELDWLPGEFLDQERRVIVCSIHGAEYAPANGRCLGGPCGRGSLIAVSVAESDAQVYWYPSRDIKVPAPVATAGAPRTTAVGASPAAAAVNISGILAQAPLPTRADAPSPTDPGAPAPSVPESLSP
jgi:nitrite reductase/ring-hydroxylating ferredoxin subunit